MSPLEYRQVQRAAGGNTEWGYLPTSDLSTDFLCKTQSEEK